MQVQNRDDTYDLSQINGFVEVYQCFLPPLQKTDHVLTCAPLVTEDHQPHACPLFQKKVETLQVLALGITRPSSRENLSGPLLFLAYKKLEVEEHDSHRRMVFSFSLVSFAADLENF